MGDQKKRKDKNTQKSRKEKVASFSSAFLFIARKWEVVNMRIDHPTRRINQGAVIVKGLEDK